MGTATIDPMARGWVRVPFVLPIWHFQAHARAIAKSARGRWAMPIDRRDLGMPPPLVRGRLCEGSRTRPDDPRLLASVTSTHALCPSNGRLEESARITSPCMPDSNRRLWKEHRRCDPMQAGIVGSHQSDAREATVRPSDPQRWRARDACVALRGVTHDFAFRSRRMAPPTMPCHGPPRLRVARADPICTRFHALHPVSKDRTSIVPPTRSVCFVHVPFLARGASVPGSHASKSRWTWTDTGVLVSVATRQGAWERDAGDGVHGRPSRGEGACRTVAWRRGRDFVRG